MLIVAGLHKGIMQEREYKVGKDGGMPNARVLLKLRDTKSKDCCSYKIPGDVFGSDISNIKPVTYSIVATCQKLW